LDYSRKVIFGILAVAVLGMIPLAYAAVGDFITSFAGNDAGGGAAFDLPVGLATNSTNFIIVGDSNANNVQIFNSEGTFFRALSGSGTAFDQPNSIAVNSTNFIIVAEAGATDRVEIYDKGGFFVRALTGSALTAVTGVAVNSTGHIFVSESGAVDLIKIYDKGGFFLKSFDGTAFGGTNFDTVTFITVDSNDRLIVYDDGTITIQIFTGNESFVSSFAGDEFGSGRAFNTVEGIAVDASNRIYVTDSNIADPDIVQIYDSTGAFLSFFTGSGTNGGGAEWTNDNVRGITVDSNGRILVVDAQNDLVQIYSSSADVTTAKSGGGGESSSAHKTRPTFGLDHNTLQQLIEGGFSFNGKSHDITDNWWTPFAEQKVKVGSTNSFTTKVFADKQLQVQEFLFGIPAVGEAHNAELGIEIVYDYSREIDSINVIQKTGIIDVDSIKVENTMSKCLSDDSDERCVTTHLSMKFLEPLQDKIMAIKAIDFRGRSHITYLNEGFDISGNSLNPMNTMMIVGTEKHEGLVEVTQTAKYSDIWIAQDDREFEMNEYGSFTQINQSFERHIDTGVMKNRLHSEFYTLKQSQADLASSIMPAYYRTSINYEDSFSEINDIFAYEYPETFNSKLDTPEIQNKMIIQAEKAQKIMEYLLDPTSYRK